MKVVINEYAEIRVIGAKDELWHEDLIRHPPRPATLGAAPRVLCSSEGNGWGKKHATVDYVFSYSPYVLYQYHTLIMDEMERRRYNVTPQ